MNMSKDYVPALGRQWLTNFYDPIVRWTSREAAFKASLLQQVAARPKDTILDVACGTGTFLLALQRAQPLVHGIGLDGDLVVLAKARAKAQDRQLHLNLQQAFSFALPYANQVFDKVASSLFFHHLTLDNKRRTLNEIYRILKPGGELHIADWGEAHHLMRLAFFAVQFVDGFGTTTDNVRGRLPQLIKESGFVDVIKTQHYLTPIGVIELYRAVKL